MVPFSSPTLSLSLSHSLSLSRILSSVPVVRRLVRTLNGDANVVSLILGELGEVSPKLSKVKSSHLLIKVLRQNVHLLLVLAGCLLLPQLELGDHLVGERA